MNLLNMQEEKLQSRNGKKKHQGTPRRGKYDMPLYLGKAFLVTNKFGWDKKAIQDPPA